QGAVPVFGDSRVQARSVSRMLGHLRPALGQVGKYCGFGFANSESICDFRAHLYRGAQSIKPFICNRLQRPSRVDLWPVKVFVFYWIQIARKRARAFRFSTAPESLVP